MLDEKDEAPSNVQVQPGREQKLHEAICLAVHEMNSVVLDKSQLFKARDILRQVLVDYADAEPPVSERTRLIREAQRHPATEVTAVMVSPATPSSVTAAQRQGFIAERDRAYAEAENWRKERWAKMDSNAAEPSVAGAGTEELLPCQQCPWCRAHPHREACSTNCQTARDRATPSPSGDAEKEAQQLLNDLIGLDSHFYVPASVYEQALQRVASALSSRSSLSDGQRRS